MPTINRRKPSSLPKKRSPTRVVRTATQNSQIRNTITSVLGFRLGPNSTQVLINAKATLKENLKIARIPFTERELNAWSREIVRRWPKEGLAPAD